MPESKGWPVVLFVLVILLQTTIWLSAQTSNTVPIKPETSQTTADKEHEAKEKALRALLGPPSASPVITREVGADELVEKRSEIEDGLRKNLLAFSKKGDFKELVNKQWNKQTIEQFGKWVIPENKEPGDSSSLLSVNKHQWACIMNLLAFVATTYRDQPVGQRAAEAFDKSLTWVASQDQGYNNYWFSCMCAIGRYGSSDLLTPTFWKAWDRGLDCRRVFQGLGNEKELMKLKNEPAADELKAIGYEFKRANMPVPQHRYKADGTIPAGTNSVTGK